ncbi:HAD-IIB family hydrolase [Mycoplasmopsis cynos]|uniref:HAD-IIB family hydrolase n=1 Tax=Mycoplasmopsis cynos TaxID=171284 RepID=UPI002AFFD9AE|nr:HAD-IIB family hydrolase [Mycoplasmopsis cynos]WQQ14376.1 HAD-IIB family hydrolase [Mycoplasmopsis cynos]
MNKLNKNTIIKIITDFSMFEDEKNDFLEKYYKNKSNRIGQKNSLVEYFKFTDRSFNNKINEFYKDSIRINFNINNNNNNNNNNKLKNQDVNEWNTFDDFIGDSKINIKNIQNIYINLFFGLKNRLMLEIGFEIGNNLGDIEDTWNKHYKEIMSDILFRFKNEEQNKKSLSWTITRTITGFLSKYTNKNYDDFILTDIQKSIKINVNHFINVFGPSNIMEYANTIGQNYDNPNNETLKYFYFDSINDIEYNEKLEENNLKKIDKDFKIIKRTESSGSGTFFYKNNLVIFSFIEDGTSTSKQWLEQDKANEIVGIYYLFSLFQKKMIINYYNDLALELNTFANDKNNEKYHFIMSKNNIFNLISEANNQVKSKANIIKFINNNYIPEDATEIEYSYCDDFGRDNSNITKNMSYYYVLINKEINLIESNELLNEQISAALEIEKQINGRIEIESKFTELDNKRQELKNKTKASLLILLSAISIIVVAIINIINLFEKFYEILNNYLTFSTIIFLISIPILIICIFLIIYQYKKNIRKFEKQIELLNKSLSFVDYEKFLSLEYSFTYKKFRYFRKIFKKNSQLKLFIIERNNKASSFNYIDIDRKLKNYFYKNRSIRRMFYNIKKMYYWKYNEFIFKNIERFFKNELIEFYDVNENEIVNIIKKYRKTDLLFENFKRFCSMKKHIPFLKLMYGRLMTILPYYKPWKNLWFDTYVFDLDGTLLSNKNELGKRTKKIIQSLYHKGKKIIIATGRPKFGALKIVNELNVDASVISYNGLLTSISNVMYEDGNEHYNELSNSKKIIDRDTCYKIAELLIDKKVDFSLHTNLKSIKFNPNNNEIHKKEEMKKGKDWEFEYIKNLDEFKASLQHQEKAMKFILIFEKIDNSIKENVIKFIDDFSMLYLVESQKNSLDIMIKGASKGNAINELKIKKYLTKNDRILAFGDSPNDESMLEATNFLVAIKNSKLHNMNKTIYHTYYDNNHEGIYYFLKNSKASFFKNIIEQTKNNHNEKNID